MKIAGIIQARMTSTRLPGKVLMPMAGQPMLARMLNRVGAATGLDELMVATTTNVEDQPIADLCSELGVRTFRGDEFDVLSRFVGAADACGADAIVRLTADCPMMDPALIDQAIAGFREGGVDYLSNVIRRSFPNGLDIEIFSRQALSLADRYGVSPFHREHVTPYMRTGGGGAFETGDFRVDDFEGPADFSHLRWTVDTPADFIAVERLVARLPDTFGWLDAVALCTRDPSLLEGRPCPLPSDVKLRPAVSRDAALLYSWVNEEGSLRNKLLTTGPIPWSDHLDWFAARTADPGSHIWIAEAQRAAIGQVRITFSAETPDTGEVDIYVAPQARGAGIGATMIELAVAELQAAARPLTLVARVLPENDASIRLFQKVDFLEADAGRDHKMFKRALGPRE